MDYLYWYNLQEGRTKDDGQECCQDQSQGRGEEDQKRRFLGGGETNHC